MNISIVQRVYKPGDIRNIDIFEVFNGIRSGVILGQDLKPITKQIQSLSDHNKQNELKKNYLPAVTFNGTFSYKDENHLLKYSAYTALDFDGFKSEEELAEIGSRLVATPCVYAVFRSPSGKGLKAIIWHDNQDSQYHEELYHQLLDKFYVANSDSSTYDLARGNYLCYDPNIWVNPNTIPFHFVHDPNYVAKQVSKSSRTNIPQNMTFDNVLAALPDIQSKKTDLSVINILNSKWKRDPTRWMQGNRKNSVFNSASQLCKAGVDWENCINYLITEYGKAGLDKRDIEYQAQRGYISNSDKFGSTRDIFDHYGSKWKR